MNQTRQVIRSNLRRCCDFLVLFITFFVPVVFNSYSEPITSYLNQAIALVVVTAFVAYSLWTGREVISNLSLTKLDLLLVVSFISLIMLAYMNSNGIEAPKSHIANALALLALYFTIKNIAKQPDFLLYILLTFVLIGIYIIITVANQIVSFSLAGSGRFPAPASDFKNPNILASYIIAIAPLISLRVKTFPTWLPIFTKVLIFLLTVVLISTQSRGAIVSVLTCGAIYVLCNKTKFNALYLKYVFTSVLLCTLGLLCYLFISKSQSTAGRSLILKLSLRLCEATPISGNGYRSFHRLYCDLQSIYLKSVQVPDSERLVADSVNFAFNEYLHLYIEFGLLWVLFVVANVTTLLTTKISSQYSILKWSLLAICGSAAFSYTFHIFSINLVLFAILGFLSSSMAPVERFTLKVPSGWKLSALKTALILSMLLISVNKVILGLKWRDAEELARFDSSASLNAYKSLYTQLSEEAIFLWYYGRLLHDTGQYHSSIKILNESLRELRQVDILLAQADNNAKLSNPAERVFLEGAVTLAPGRLFPKYYLMLYFLKQNDTENALMIARAVERLPVKVITPDAMAIKGEAAATVSLILSKDKNFEPKQAK